MTHHDVANFLIMNPDHLTPVIPGAIPCDVFSRISGTMVMKECYNNSLNAMISLNGKCVVLGVAIIKDLGFPVEHAWIQLSDGSHVDPTFQSQHGENYVNKYAYYALHSIPRQDYFPLARKFSRGDTLYAIDMTSLRRDKDTQHLFKNERMEKAFRTVSKK